MGATEISDGQRAVPKQSWLQKIEAIKPFTPTEAWNVFRLAAFSEAFGWTLLIAAVIIQRYKLPGQAIAVPIAGQIHGTIFLSYFGVLIAIYTSLGWSRGQALLAIVAGVPPYGSIIFEQWVVRHRSISHIAAVPTMVQAVIQNGDRFLAIQPNNDVRWQLPGGAVQPGETKRAALRRILVELTGVVPVIGPACRDITGNKHTFTVLNPNDFATIDRAALARKNPAIDELGYVAFAEL